MWLVYLHKKEIAGVCFSERDSRRFVKYEINFYLFSMPTMMISA